MGKKSDQIERLEARMDEIVELLRILTKRNSNVPGIPVKEIPSTTPYNPTQPWQLPSLPSVPDLGFTCPRCGMKFSGVTGYVCQDPTCPTGLGPTIATI